MNIGAVLIISFTAVLYFSKQLKDSNKKVYDTTIELKNSIIAASHIQRTIIGESEIMRLCEQQKCFAFCKPKDIVCGDFIWARTIDNKEYYIVADSNENGVPGALLTILGNNGLNEIVISRKILEPAKIIKEMITYFSSFERNIQSGNKQDNQKSYKLNLSILLLERDLKKITFAGINNRVIQVFPEKKGLDPNRIIEISGDEYDTGIPEITSHKVSFVDGSIIYLFTSGYENQIGSQGFRTFKYKRFRELLLRISNLDLSMQERTLEDEFNAFKQTQVQTDDVLVLGLKI